MELSINSILNEIVSEIAQPKTQALQESEMPQDGNSYYDGMGKAIKDHVENQNKNGAIQAAEAAAEKVKDAVKDAVDNATMANDPKGRMAQTPEIDGGVNTYDDANPSLLNQGVTFVQDNPWAVGIPAALAAGAGALALRRKIKASREQA